MRKTKTKAIITNMADEEKFVAQLDETRYVNGFIRYPSTVCWKNKYGIILTHGAGGDCNNSHLIHLTDSLTRCGFLVLRFNCKPPNFQYRVKCYKAVVDFCIENIKLTGIILAGRSMGGRVAAEVVTKYHSFNGLVFGVACFSYPLHKPKQFTELRVSHLKHVTLPTFIVNGTRDIMCDQNLMMKLVESMQSNVTMHWVKDADHSLNIKGVNSRIETIENVSQWFVEWCQTVFSVEVT